MVFYIISYGYINEHDKTCFKDTLTIPGLFVSIVKGNDSETSFSGIYFLCL